MARTDRDSDGKPTGKLCVVATPLGNPDDLSPRARATLARADVILAEDTRSARRLLTDAGLPAETTTKLISCFDANESARAAEAVAWVAAGQCVVVISEAGTPLVSDPGFRVAAAVAAAGLRVEPIPGPSALLAALVGSGLSPDHFTFLGFPPRKSGARRRLFESLRTHPYTLILYESPMRTADTLADLAAVLGGERRACVARELTKTYEEFVRDTLGALAEKYRVDRPLGEVTLVVAGAASDALVEAFTDETIQVEARELLASGMSARDASTELAVRSGRPRREVYALVTAIASEGETDEG